MREPIQSGLLRPEAVEALLTELAERHGYDFTGYARASLYRRIARLMAIDRFPSFAELQYRLHSDETYLRRFVEEITVNVTEMFRDPQFYRFLRTEIVPVLATYPLIRIWHAGCSTGEEVYSMAILLEETGLLKKSLLYATDLNPDVLERARRGVFPLSEIRQYSENYIESGGRGEFSAYYAAKYGKARFANRLRERMVFAAHNLVSDHSFNEFQLILCRNVLIYFNRELQERVFSLLDDSLEPLGFLALGSRETIRFSRIERKYQQQKGERIWRKIG